jgi:hypothetical protein
LLAEESAAAAEVVPIPEHEYSSCSLLFSVSSGVAVLKGAAMHQWLFKWFRVYMYLVCY